ncbi:MAG TPA: histidinol-phosphate transaminase [Candidatus Sulfotelmatobacter sp.]|nr:histidinol-phosphate transaminase [Candidatus Sulfotelmatobacter sp.]
MSRFFDLLVNPARYSDRSSGSSVRQSDTNPESAMIRLDSNENPFGPSPLALDAMREALESSNFYPEDDSAPLRRKLADVHELPAEQILVTAGSTQMLSLLCQTLLGPGLNAITSERSFIVYGMAVRATGAQLIEAPMRGDQINLTAMLDLINEHTRIVFLANPNNPTGTMLDSASIDKFIAEVHGHVVIVLDEAYHDFAAHFAERRKVEYSDSLRYLRKEGNVVVLRTFSKAHGLAGLRIGYGLGPAELMGYCARMRNTFSVSSVAQAAALAALQDQAHVLRAVTSNAEQAQSLGVGLSELGFRVVPTWANFLYCNVGEEAAGFAERLRGHGISVRPLETWGAPGCIRVSIGTPQQNEALLRALQGMGKKMPDARVVGE